MDLQNKKILIIDDDRDLCEVLKFNLSGEGFIIEIAHSGEEALKRPLKSADMILLDIIMEDMSGFTFAGILRNELKLNTPVIFISARNSESDILEGFNYDADDYVVKPFSMNELLVRIRAVLNRCAVKKKPALFRISYGEIEFDPGLSRIIVNDEFEELTRKECEILKLIINNPGKIFSREDILKKIWGRETKIELRTVDVHITRIRSKMGEFSHYLKNKAGFGYYLEPIP